MNKKVTGIIILISVAALGTGAYLLFRDKKKVYARTIQKKGGSSQTILWLSSLEEGYLKAWAQALENGKISFMYQGNSYNAKGGKAMAVETAAPGTPGNPVVYKGIEQDGYWL